MIKKTGTFSYTLPDKKKFQQKLSAHPAGWLLPIIIQ
jgi:hypothetical protein